MAVIPNFFGNNGKIAFCNFGTKTDALLFMVLRMIRACGEQIEIFRSVVISYFVDVVDRFRLSKRSSNNIRCDLPMLAYQSLFIGLRVIRKKNLYVIPNMFLIPHKVVVAFIGTVARFDVLRMANRCVNRFIAIGTWKINSFCKSLSYFFLPLLRCFPKAKTNFAYVTTFVRAKMSFSSMESTWGSLNMIFANIAQCLKSFHTFYSLMVIPPKSKWLIA